MLKTLSPETVVTADPELDSQVEKNVLVSNPEVELARSYYQQLAKSQTELPWLEQLHDSLACVESDLQIQEYITRPTAPPPEHTENR